MPLTTAQDLSFDDFQIDDVVDKKATARGVAGCFDFLARAFHQCPLELEQCGQ